MKRVTAYPPWHDPLPADDRVVIPGYASLHDLSRDQEAAVKAGLPGRFWTLVHWTNWRVVFPFPGWHQERVAGQVVAELRGRARGATARDQFSRMGAEPHGSSLRLPDRRQWSGGIHGLSSEVVAGVDRYLRLDGPRLRFVTRRHATSTLGLLAALRRDELVAMQGDRPTGERGDVVLPFFGDPAAFPIGPFILARATGAPVLPVFCSMTADARYQIVIEPPIWVKPGEEVAAVATMIGALERAVRAHPTQWFNFFDVWSHPRAAA